MLGNFVITLAVEVQGDRCSKKGYILLNLPPLVLQRVLISLRCPFCIQNGLSFARFDSDYVRLLLSEAEVYYLNAF